MNIKAAQLPPKPPHVYVSMELNYNEACALLALCGIVSGADPGPSTVARKLHEEISKALGLCIGSREWPLKLLKQTVKMPDTYEELYK